MLKLTETQLVRLKSTKIGFSYREASETWIDGGIVSIPTRQTFAEDYASYFTRSEFYTIGAFSYSWSPFPETVSLGRYCSVAQGVDILPPSHPTDLFTTSSMIYDPSLMHRKMYYQDSGYKNNDVVSGNHPSNSKDIVIGHDVYIGSGAKLRRGITIGNGAIIGAHSVVTKDVVPYSVVAGNPARLVRLRYTEKQIDILNQIKWWDFEFSSVLNKTHISNIDLFIDRLQHMIDVGEIAKFTPKRNYIREILA